MIKKFDEHRQDLKPYGLTCELWQPNVMRRPDRHNEIEINFLPEGSITYLIHDQKFKIKEDTTVVFWALMPHQIIDFKKEYPYYVVTIPFSLLMQWNLPKPFLDILFNGQVQTLEGSKYPFVYDRLFERWSRDLEKTNTQYQEICELEIQAYVKRFAIEVSNANHMVHKGDDAPISLVEQIAIFIACNFTKPIKVADVANNVGLHPDYANSIFKKTFGSTISNYLIQQRVLFVQRRLAVSNKSVTTIAYEAGFNSISRFNAGFRKYTGMTPREYRSAIRTI